MQNWQRGQQKNPEIVPRSLPRNLLAPTYQNRLRTVGRQLDLGRYRSVTIVEVAGGFIGRAVSRRERVIELLEFLDEDFPERMVLATEARGQGERGEAPSPLAPTGWEDLLRSVGRWLDEHHANCVVIAESPSALVISGETRPPGGSSGPIDLVLDPESLTELLNASFLLRGTTPPAQGGAT